MKYKQISDEVVRLRYEEKMSFKAIALHLKVSEATVRRAYDYECPDVVNASIALNKRPFEGATLD